MPYVGTGETLAHLMRLNGVGCYQGQDHLYYLERGIGEVSRKAIDDALARGLILPKWADSPQLEYWRAT
jgi:hypothetical protein